MKADIEHFRMPRYREIPNIGLYLDQTVKYINVVLQPLGCIEATPSMVSNYVKKGYIAKPVKKQYNEQQIAYLLFIMVAKLVLSMDNIETLFRKQQETASVREVYDSFCESFEKTLRGVFGLEQDQDPQSSARTVPAVSGAEIDDVRLLRSVIMTASNAIYISHCFEVMRS